jgi:protein-tyrosine phosphatase
LGVSKIIKNYYGSKRGLLRYFIFSTFHRVGVYAPLKRIDFTKVTRLVFVCHGNICRSPLGEVIARSAGVSSASFGLHTRSNDPADPRAVAWANANGYDLGGHRTTALDGYTPTNGDLLIGMEPKHTKQLLRRFSGLPVQITLAGLWLDPACVYLHDPYNTNQSYFDLCEQKVELSTKAILKKLNANKAAAGGGSKVYE